MKILIAVASKHGSTREIAETIAAELRDAHHTVYLRDAGEVEELAKYDAVILGSAVYAGQWMQEARTFADRQRAELAQRPLWAFSSGPLGAEDPQPRDDPQQLAASLGDLAVRDHRVFVGKLDKGSLSLGERFVALAIKAPAGDFRDWAAVRAWAREIATALLAGATPTPEEAAAGPSCMKAARPVLVVRQLLGLKPASLRARSL